MRNALDISQIQTFFDEAEVSEIFEEIFPPQSDVIVHEVVNLIFVLRNLI